MANSLRYAKIFIQNESATRSPTHWPPPQMRIVSNNVLTIIWKDRLIIIANTRALLSRKKIQRIRTYRFKVEPLCRVVTKTCNSAPHFTSYRVQSPASRSQAKWEFVFFGYVQTKQVHITYLAPKSLKELSSVVRCATLECQKCRCKLGSCYPSPGIPEALLFKPQLPFTSKRCGPVTLHPAFFGMLVQELISIGTSNWTWKAVRSVAVPRFTLHESVWET